MRNDISLVILIVTSALLKTIMNTTGYGAPALFGDESVVPESSAGPESHAVASIASIPDTPIARNSMRSLSGLPMN